MQSGTILHLALLKKISQRSPCNYREKFHQFKRCNENQLKPLEQSTISYSNQKYSSVLDNQKYCKRDLNKFGTDHKIHNSKKKRSLQQNLTISAWSTQNFDQEEGTKQRKQNIRYVKKPLNEIKDMETRIKTFRERRKYSECSTREKVYYSHQKMYPNNSEEEIINFLRSKKKIKEQHGQKLNFRRKKREIKPMNFDFHPNKQNQKDQSSSKMQNSQNKNPSGSFFSLSKMQQIIPHSHARINSFDQFISELNIRKKQKKYMIRQ